MTATPVEELRTAAARLRAELPAYAAGTAYVVQGDSENMDTIAWCNTDHTDDPAPACCVEAIETGHPALAQMIAALLNAREPLAVLFDHFAVKYERLAEMFGAPATAPSDRLAEGAPELHIDFALAVARQINGAAPAPVYAPVWDGSCAPGGMVCNLCGTPVESEPCSEHATTEELRDAGALTEGAAL